MIYSWHNQYYNVAIEVRDHQLTNAPIRVLEAITEF
jgi:hypothetical protein